MNKVIRIKINTVLFVVAMLSVPALVLLTPVYCDVGPENTTFPNAAATTESANSSTESPSTAPPSIPTPAVPVSTSAPTPSALPSSQVVLTAQPVSTSAVPPAPAYNQSTPQYAPPSARAKKKNPGPLNFFIGMFKSLAGQ